MEFNLCSFGETFRKKREELGLTLKNVSDSSGVNCETIRRIEYGKVIPKFETLEFLSTIYKQDLNSLFLKYRPNDYSYYYEIKNRLERKLDCDEFYNLQIELNELKSLIKHTENSLYRNHINQLILLTKAIILYKSDNNNIEALNTLTKAMNITTPNFDLNNYTSFTYSSIEIRILMNIAFVMNKLNKANEYQEIMEFCINTVEINDELYPKLCHNLAGVYRRTKKYQRAFELSDLGIKSCQKTRNYNGLNLLYYGKGIAAYHLGNPEYIKFFKISITLCEALEQVKLKEKIENNCKEILEIEFKKAL